MAKIIRRLKMCQIVLGALVAVSVGCHSDSRTGVALSMKIDSSAAALAGSIAKLEFAVTGDETFTQEYSFARAPFGDGEERVVVRLNKETRTVSVAVYGINAAGSRILSASVGPIAIASQKLSAASITLLTVTVGDDFATDLAGQDLTGVDAVMSPDLSSQIDMAVNVPPVAFGQPSFGSMTFGAAKQLLSGDLNRDGRVDLVWLAKDNKVHVLLGTGTGDFVDSDQIALVGSNIEQLRVADFNGDGATDLAWLSLNAGFYIMLNRGDAGFEPAVFYARAGATFFQNSTPKLSRPDIFVSTGSVLYRYNNNGTGTFPTSGNKMAEASVSYFCVGDVDANEPADVIVPGSGGDTLVYRSGGSTFLEPEHYSVSGVQCITGDFTGDNKVDIAMASTDNFIILPGSGTGSFGMPITTPASHIDNLVAIEFSGDALLDILVVIDDGIQLTPYRNQGGGQFMALDDVIHKTPYDRARFPVAADFNNDNKPDVAWADRSRMGVQIAIGDGLFNAPVTLIPQGEVTAFAIGTNGSPPSSFSVIAARTDDALISASQGCSHTDGLNLGQRSYVVGPNPSAILMTDLDGDSVPDLVVSNKGNATVNVFQGLSNMDQYFMPAGSHTVGVSPIALGAANFSGDSKLDIVVANQDSNHVTLLRQNPSGFFFESAGTYPLGAAPVAMVVADYNNDGKMDVLTALKETNQIGLLEGNGSAFVPVKTVALPNGTAPVAILNADFNGDGKVDLAVMSQSANRVYILLGNGNGTFEVVNNVPVAQPSGMVLGDWNTDGKIDIVVASSSQRRLLVYLGGGHGFFGSPLSLSTVGVASDLRSYPLSNKNKPDIVGIVGNYCMNFPNMTP